MVELQGGGFALKQFRSGMAIGNLYRLWLAGPLEAVKDIFVLILRRVRESVPLYGTLRILHGLCWALLRSGF